MFDYKAQLKLFSELEAMVDERDMPDHRAIDTPKPTMALSNWFWVRALRHWKRVKASNAK